jgi:hypothetical protein
MMTKPREQVTLVDVLVDGFEKNELLDGTHWRRLPMPDEASAIAKLAALVEEATRWKGNPVRTFEQGKRRLAGWDDIEIRQTGEMILVRVKTPWFDGWWHVEETWSGSGHDDVHDWLSEDEAATERWIKSAG